MKAKKVVIEFGATPKDCLVLVDGKKIQNVTDVEASITIEDGPQVSLTLVKDDLTSEVCDIDFDTVIENLR